MIYREITHVGDVMKEREYEGTPEEIKQVIESHQSLDNKESDLTCKVCVDGKAITKQIAKELEHYMAHRQRVKGFH